LRATGQPAKSAAELSRFHPITVVVSSRRHGGDPAKSLTKNNLRLVISSPIRTSPMKTKILNLLVALAWLAAFNAQRSTAFAQSAPFSTTIQATGTVMVVNGFIVGANLGNGGDGYPGPPLVSVVDPSGSNVVIVAAISSDGVVTNLAVKNAGSHYTAGAALVIAPPPTNPIPNDINVIISPYLTDNIRSGQALSSGGGNWALSATNYTSGGFYTNYAGISFFLAAFPGTNNGCAENK
jgi:hypothetical protein